MGIQRSWDGSSGGSGGVWGEDPCNGDPTGCEVVSPWPIWPVVLIAFGAAGTAAAGDLSQSGPQSSSSQSSTTTNSANLSPAEAVCEPKVLSAVNQTTGTNLTAGGNVLGDPYAYPAVPGGTLNVNLGASGLAAAQFNAIQPGRYPLNWWTYLIGYGPTLHIVSGPGYFNPKALQFTNDNVGGLTSVLFTAHIDSAFLYNPIGALIHLLKDVWGIGGHSSCPG